MSYSRIVIKVGSNILTKSNGTLNISTIALLVDQIAQLRSMNIEVILVSSGSVAAGRSEVETTKTLDPVSARQLWSSVGQVKLINRYADLFNQYNITVSQVLATKDSFSNREKYLNMKNCISTLLENNIIPIINENDTISVEELMFTDNDELAGLVASMSYSEQLIILSNIDGIFTGDPSLSSSEVVTDITPENREAEEYILPLKSGFGRGGMITKYNIAKKLSHEGIEVVIANGNIDNILIDIAKNCEEVSTRFIATVDKTSAVKRWLAHSSDFSRGEITVNPGVVTAIKRRSTTSILPVGIVSSNGEFNSGDIVLILDSRGEQVGIGKSSYSTEELSEVIGKKQHKPVVHYDHLYIDNEYLEDIKLQ